MIPGILNRIVEKIGDRGAQLLRIAGDHISRSIQSGFITYCFRGKMMAGTGDLNGFPHQYVKIEREELAGLFVSSFSGFQYLFDGSQQAVGIVEHDAIEGAPLRLVYVAPLQGLQVKTDRSQRRLQLVGNGINKTVVLFVAPDFSHQKTGVENQAGRDSAEEYNPQKDPDTGLPIENNPAKSNRHSHCGQANSQRQKNDDLAAAGEAHGQILPRGDGILSLSS